MNNKVLVNIYVPKIEESYDVFIPIGRKVKKIIILSSKAVSELSNNTFPKNGANNLFNANTGDKYDPELIIKDTDIRNGTKLILF